MKIIVVDDKEEERYLEETLLKGSGYQVTLATNGVEALEKLRAGDFDIIISDILMPVMDGFRLCQECRADEKLKRIPFVFATATYKDEGDEKLALELGADRFIRKPVEPEEFINIIQGVVKDIEEGRASLKKPVEQKGTEVFKLYSQSLVRKLESKMLDLEVETARRKRAQEEAERLNTVLNAIRNINQLIVKEKKRDRLLSRTCAILTKTRGYDKTFICLFDDARKLIAHAEAGLDSDFLAVVERLKCGELTKCITRTLAQSGVLITESSPLVCGDCPLIKTCGGKKVVTIRIEHGGKVYGLLELQLSGGFSILNEEQSLLQEVTSDIAFALRNIESEERIVYLASFPEFSPNPVLEVDQEGNIRYQNPAAKTVFPDIADLELNHPFLANWAQVVKELRSSNWHKEIIREVAVNDLIYKQTISPVAQNQIRVYGTDITRRIQLMKSLAESEERFRGIVDNISLGIFRTTPGRKGKFIAVNPAMEKITGYSKKELLSMNVSDLYANPEERVKILKAVESSPVPVPHDIRFRRKDGTEIIISDTKVPVRGADSKTLYFDGILEDVTERRQMQEQLIVTDRLASIGELSAGIAHEINNPLTGVVGFSDLLLGRKDLPQDVQEDLEVINKEAKRTAEIIKNLLTFARRHEVENASTDINKVIQNVLDLRAYEQRVNNIEVKTSFSSDIPEIKADAFRLQQVFLNIVINAEFFMHEAHGKGTLTITTERVKDMIRASFTDDGPGVSKENMSHLFDPFFTTKKGGKGTGLGLSICHGIIAEYGGKIYVESKPGKGATFVVELPIGR